MASARTRVASLALLSLFQQPGAIEDAEALIQSRWVQERALALPAVGADGLAFSRVSGSAEAGNSWVLNFTDFGTGGHQCEQYDEHGPQECAFYYGEPFRTVFTVNLDGGVQSGDSYYHSWDFDLSCNESDFWSFLVPKNFLVEGRCTACQDSCSFSTVTSKLSLKVTMPTVWENNAICSGSAPAENVLANFTGQWFQLPTSLAVGGTFKEKIAVYDSSDNARVSGEYQYTLTAPSMLAATPEHSNLQQLHNDPRSFPGDLLGWITDAVQATRISKGSKKLGNLASKNLMFDFVVKTINSGSSVAITASTGCTSTDSSGSVSCEFGLGETVSISTAFNLGFTAAEGSNLYKSRKFHLGGNLSAIVDMLLPKFETVAPLCGDGSQLSKCGDYRFELSTNPADIKMLDDFVSFDFPALEKLPFLPQTFDDLLPISYTQEMQIRNPDNSTIIGFEVTYGLKTA